MCEVSLELFRVERTVVSRGTYTVVTILPSPTAVEQEG